MLRQTSVPTLKAITLDVVKDHLRVDQDLEDGLIAAYLDAAIDACATYTNRALNQAEWQASFNCWPACDYFHLPIAPIVTVHALKYFDEDGTEQTVDPASWWFVHTDDGGRVYVSQDYDRPTLRTEPPDQIYIEFLAGYDSEDGSSGTDAELTMPAAIKSAILLTVGHLYANRESVVVGKAAVEIPSGAKFLLDLKRIYR